MKRFVRDYIKQEFSPYYSFQASFDKELNGFINKDSLINIEIIKTNTEQKELPISLYKREIKLLIKFLKDLDLRMIEISKKELKNKKVKNNDE